MSKLLSTLDSCLKFLVVTAIGLMLAIVFLQVISRYLFSYTPSIAEELARYLFVWVVFLALPLVAKSGGHMAIETLTARISGMKLKVCRALADICTLTFLAIMVYNGYFMVTIAHYQTSPAMVIPMSYVYCVIPFGCAIMFCNVLANFISLVRTPADEVK